MNDQHVRDLLDDERLTVAGLFFESHAGISVPLEHQIADHGLVTARFEVLMRLARTPGHSLRMSDLAAQSSLSLSGLTRAIDRLVEQDLVTRRSCPTDRRGSFAHLTDAGMAMVEAVLPGHIRVLEECLLAPLDDSERAQFETLLRKVRDHVSPHAVTLTTDTDC